MNLSVFDFFSSKTKWNSRRFIKFNTLIHSFVKVCEGVFCSLSLNHSSRQMLSYLWTLDNANCHFSWTHYTHLLLRLLFIFELWLNLNMKSLQYSEENLHFLVGIHKIQNKLQRNSIVTKSSFTTTNTNRSIMFSFFEMTDVVTTKIT